VGGDRDKLGERIVRTLLGIWDSPAGSAAAAMLRSAVQQPWTAKLLREFLLTQIIRNAMRRLGIPPEEAAIRASLAISQMLGLIMARYIILVEPLVSASPDLIVELIGPTMQRYLTGALPATAFSSAPGAQ